MINFIIGFIIGAMMMMCAIAMVAIQKDKKPRNKIRFYVTSDPIRHPAWIKLWMGEPVWDSKYLMWSRPSNHVFYLTDSSFFRELYNIDPKDFEDMKPKEIREVFINLED